MAVMPSGLEVACVCGLSSVIAGLTACIDHMHSNATWSLWSRLAQPLPCVPKHAGHRAPSACNVDIKVGAYITYLTCVLCWAFSRVSGGS